MRTDRRFVVLSAALAAGWGRFAPALALDRALLIFAAASLKNALDQAAALWTATQERPAPKISYAGSNTLAKQIEQGAPADIFISADTDWMDYLAEKRLIKPETRVELLGNRIVLAAPKTSATKLTIAPGFDLAGALGSGRLAMANVEAVPAGKYGKSALEKLGVWNSVSARIAQADNVRAALALVARGEAPLGVVYATDAAADPNVTVVATFPEDSHPPIRYPVAATAAAKGADAAAFLGFLRSAPAAKIFAAEGFSTLASPASGS